MAAVTDNRAAAVSGIQIRDRIKELRRVRAKELLPNPKNWRRHPKAQAEALRGLLAEVGYAGCVAGSDVTRWTPDDHRRASPRRDHT